MVRKHLIILSMTAVALVPIYSEAASSPFSVDLTKFTYTYESVVQQPDFTIAGGFPAGHIDPASGWYLSWDALEVPVTSYSVGSSWRMTTPQATAADPSPPRALSSINGYNLSAGYPAYAPSNWTVIADMTNVSNATNNGTFYNVEVGVGNYGSDVVSAKIRALWFTGDVLGTHYDHVLAFSSVVTVPGLEWDSGYPSPILTDLNPQDTQLSLKVAITGGGQTFSSYFKLDGEPNWTLAQTYTLPAGAGSIDGFAASHPYIRINDELAPIPEPATAWYILAGLLVFSLYARLRNRRIPDSSRPDITFGIGRSRRTCAGSA